MLDNVTLHEIKWAIFQCISGRVGLHIHNYMHRHLKFLHDGGDAISSHFNRNLAMRSGENVAVTSQLTNFDGTVCSLVDAFGTFLNCLVNLWRLCGGCDVFTKLRRSTFHYSAEFIGAVHQHAWPHVCSCKSKASLELFTWQLVEIPLYISIAACSPLDQRAGMSS